MLKKDETVLNNMIILIDFDNIQRAKGIPIIFDNYNKKYISKNVLLASLCYKLNENLYANDIEKNKIYSGINKILNMKGISNHEHKEYNKLLEKLSSKHIIKIEDDDNHNVIVKKNNESNKATNDFFTREKNHVIEICKDIKIYYDLYNKNKIEKKDTWNNYTNKLPNIPLEFITFNEFKFEINFELLQNKNIDIYNNINDLFKKYKIFEKNEEDNYKILKNILNTYKILLDKYQNILDDETKNILNLMNQNI
jgi:hypothetical protein